MHKYHLKTITYVNTHYYANTNSATSQKQANILLTNFQTSFNHMLSEKFAIK